MEAGDKENEPEMSGGSHTGWKKYLAPVGKLTGQALSQMIGTVLAAGALIALSKEETDAQEREKKTRSAREEERTILQSHKEYSQCMADLYDFEGVSSKDGLEYHEKFLEEMGAKPRNDSIRRVNACRSIAKDYWYQVFAWMEQYPEYLQDNPQKKARFKSRYRRFVRLVEPLDRLGDYDPEDRAIFQQDGVFNQTAQHH